METDKAFELMFLPENEGKFREGHRSSKREQSDYIEFLKKSSKRFVRYEIFFKNELAGFIMVGGIDARLVGGIYPEFQRKGIYTVARNTILYALNMKGFFEVSSSVHKSNKEMKEFLTTMIQTKLDHDLRLSLNHFDPTKEIAICDYDFEINPGKLQRRLFHISFDNNLPDVIRPKLPAGSELPEGTYPERLPARFSASPSVELCFRAIYPNVAHLLEGVDEDTIIFSVYEVMNPKPDYKPSDLIEGNYVHDAHVTLEHVFLKPVHIKKVGTVEFLNTSDGGGLEYCPFATEKNRFHSPKLIATI